MSFDLTNGKESNWEAKNLFLTEHGTSKDHYKLFGYEAVLQKMINSAIKLTNSAQGCIFLFDKFNNVLECQVVTDCKFYEQTKKKCLLSVNDTQKLVPHVFTQRAVMKVNHLTDTNFGHHHENFPQKKIKSFLAIPLLENESIPIGVFILESFSQSHYSDKHVEIMQTIADFGIMALKSSINLQQKNQIIQKLSLLSEASDKLLSEFKNFPLEKKFDFFVEKIIRIVDAELCSFFLVEDNHLVLKSSFAYENKNIVRKIEKENIILPIKSGIGTGHTGAIAHSKKVYNEFGEKLRSHPASKRPKGTHFLPSNYNYSELAYPMVDENSELIGLLIAYNKLGPDGKPLIHEGFSKEFDEQLMKILTTKLTISLKNNSLVNKLKQYQLIIENSPDPVVMTTLDGTITFINKAGKQVFGDLTDKKASSYYYTDEYSTSLEKAREVMKALRQSPEGIVSNFETKFLSKDGSPFQVTGSFGFIYDDKGNPQGTLGLVKNIGKEKKLFEVGNKLLSLRQIDEILNTISDLCLSFPRAIRAYIKLYNDQTDELDIHALKSKIIGEQPPQKSTHKYRGITGYVFKTQSPYISSDLKQEAKDRYCGLFTDVKSKIVVPLNLLDQETGMKRTLGVINVDSDVKDAFSASDMYSLSAIANQAATAIENANLIQEQKNIIRELTAMEKIQETITKTFSFDQLLESLLDVVVDLLDFNYATISLVNYPVEGMIGTIKGRNVPDEFLKEAVHDLDSNDIQAWVVHHRQEVKLSTWDDRLDPDIYKKYNHEKLVRVYLPIISGGKAVGTLETGYFKDVKDDFTRRENETLKKIVDLVGIGIEQVKLIENQKELVAQLKQDIEMRNQLDRQLQALNEASINVQYSQTEEEAVHYIFKSLKSIGYDKGQISLINQATGIIEGKYTIGENWAKIRKETKRDSKSNDILALAIRKKEPILSKDCFKDPRCHKEAISKANIKSQFVIPLIVKDQAIGTLQIDLTDHQDLVRGDEKILCRTMNILKTFANQSAIAIRNVGDMVTINILQSLLTETAHEFRSPLHNIITQVGGLRNYILKGHAKEDELKEFFDIITEEVLRAKRQMENTLMLSDKSMNLIGYNFEKGFLQDVVQRCTLNYRFRALERGISIIIKPNVNKLPSFKFDKVKMEQVISNLLDNAIKYSHYHRSINISGFDDNNWIHLSISDKGQGIPESEYDKIFEGFRRSQIKDKKRYIPGTGLGLKICKEIIDGHGGRITVKSSPFFDDPRRRKIYEGFDTVFTVILPKR